MPPRLWSASEAADPRPSRPAATYACRSSVSPRSRSPSCPTMKPRLARVRHALRWSAAFELLERGGVFADTRLGIIPVRRPHGPDLMHPGQHHRVEIVGRADQLL